MKKSWPAGVLAAFLLMASLSYADGIDDLKRLITGSGNGDSRVAVATTPPETATADTAAVVDDSLIRLTPDRTKLLRLDQDAASVIVTNPAHASVALESQRLLVIMPRAPGTTAFTVLNRDGQVILEKSIIVTAAESKYVRVRRICDGAEGCVESAFYYCPDGCYEVTPVPAMDGPMEVPDAGGSGASISSLIPAGADPTMQQPPSFEDAELIEEIEEIQERATEMIDTLNLPDPREEGPVE